jgi:hypothetical protein
MGGGLDPPFALWGPGSTALQGQGQSEQEQHGCERYGRIDFNPNSLSAVLQREHVLDVSVRPLLAAPISLRYTHLNPNGPTQHPEALNTHFPFHRLEGNNERAGRFERAPPEDVPVPVPTAEFDPLGALRKILFDPPISLNEMGT